MKNILHFENVRKKTPIELLDAVRASMLDAPLGNIKHAPDTRKYIDNYCSAHQQIGTGLYFLLKENKNLLYIGRAKWGIWYRATRYRYHPLKLIQAMPISYVVIVLFDNSFDNDKHKSNGKFDEVIGKLVKIEPILIGLLSPDYNSNFNNPYHYHNNQKYRDIALEKIISPN